MSEGRSGRETCRDNNDKRFEIPRRGNHRRTKLEGFHHPHSLIIHLDATVRFLIVILLVSRGTTNAGRRRSAHVALVVSGRVPTTTVATFPGRAHVLLIFGPDRSRFRVHAIERGGLARVVEAFEGRACYVSSRILSSSAFFSSSGSGAVGARE